MAPKRVEAANKAGDAESTMMAAMVAALAKMGKPNRVEIPLL
jgi:hypothetical protein